jgi:hypothetical protein
MENIRNAIITPQQKACQDLQCEWKMKETPSSPTAKSSSGPAL